VLSGWSQNDPLDLAIRNIIINSILSAENKQIGAGIICAYLLINRHNIDETAKRRDTLKHRAEVADIDNTLRYFLGSGLIYNLMQQIVRAGGLSASWNFDFTHTNSFIVQTYLTKEILGEIHPLFSEREKISRLDSPLIIAIDGVIESLGEIDHILQDLASEKCNAVICATGIAPDVVTTLSENWLASKLSVVPFTVREWKVTSIRENASKEDALETCQELNIKCVSAELGETLRSASLDDFIKHDHILFSRQGMALPNSRGTSQHVEIRVPKRMASLIGVISDRCKVAQKACTGVTKSGTCNSSLIETITNKNENIRPHVSHSAELVGVRAATSCRRLMDNIGSIVLRV